VYSPSKKLVSAQMKSPHYDITLTHPLLTCQSLQKPVLDPPFIESHQRVCTYNETRLETVQLPNCSADVDPSYTYPVAIRCDCVVCLTSTTECITSVWYAGENSHFVMVKTPKAMCTAGIKWISLISMYVWERFYLQMVSVCFGCLSILLRFFLKRAKL